MRELTTTVWATHRFAGFHEWPDAPIERAYLASPHRHLFHVRAEIDVHHDDREIEFHDLFDVIEVWAHAQQAAGGASCEMLAKSLHITLEVRWPGRAIAVDVSEDGEFGARVLSERD